MKFNFIIFPDVFHWMNFATNGESFKPTREEKVNYQTVLLGPAIRQNRKDTTSKKENQK